MSKDESGYFVPKKRLARFMSGLAMNNQEGVYLYGSGDPSIRELLPPPLELFSPESPMVYVYIVNIREPSFGSWYMEGGIGTLASYREQIGMYFFNVQLSGPGALMGLLVGRESAGLPKKLCEAIVVERTDTYGHCCIDRNGVRLVDIELEIGHYNDPSYHADAENCREAEEGMVLEGGCLLHKYGVNAETGVDALELISYDSPTRYYTWEPASATVHLGSSIDDPWADIPLRSVYGAGWSVCDNWINGTSVLYQYPKDEAADAMQHLFTGRYDRGMLGERHQQYDSKQIS